MSLKFFPETVNLKQQEIEEKLGFMRVFRQFVIDKLRNPALSAK